MTHPTRCNFDDILSVASSKTGTAFCTTHCRMCSFKSQHSVLPDSNGHEKAINFVVRLLYMKFVAHMCYTIRSSKVCAQGSTLLV